MHTMDLSIAIDGFIDVVWNDETIEQVDDYWCYSKHYYYSLIVLAKHRLSMNKYQNLSNTILECFRKQGLSGDSLVTD